MLTADILLLDAKQAILHEQHRRFKALQQEGRLQEAMEQFQVTLACASDLLKHSLAILERLAAQQKQSNEQAPPSYPA